MVNCVQDPDLKERAASLPDLVLNRWAPSTTHKYQAAWARWIDWCSNYMESPPLPAEPFYIALYFNDLVLQGCKFGTLDSASSGIRWGHVSAGLSSPTDHILVKTALEGAKRRVGKSKGKNQKDPITTDMITHMVDHLGTSDNLQKHRQIVIGLLMFAGFLRISELLEIKFGDCAFLPTHLQITIPKAKNDQVREGHVVYICRTGSYYCPVGWIESYTQKTGLLDKADHLVCRLAKTKNGHNAHGNRPLTDSTVRQLFNKDVLPICQEKEPGNYGLHSFRSGGASTAINNGVSERLVGKHGRWKSGYSRDRYLKDSKRRRLNVSSSLGL